jgi:hypothetical protein
MLPADSSFLAGNCLISIGFAQVTFIDAMSRFVRRLDILETLIVEFHKQLRRLGARSTHSHYGRSFRGVSGCNNIGHKRTMMNPTITYRYNRSR